LELIFFCAVKHGTRVERLCLGNYMEPFWGFIWNLLAQPVMEPFPLYASRMSSLQFFLQELHFRHT